MSVLSCATGRISPSGEPALVACDVVRLGDEGAFGVLRRLADPMARVPP